VTLADAGGGAGTWSLAVDRQTNVAGLEIAAPATVTVPGRLDITVDARAGADDGEVTGFFVLTRGSDTRRIPFWSSVRHPELDREPRTTLTRPGVYAGTTVGGASLVSRYRFPTGGDATYPGPERVYRYTVRQPVANFGVAVLSGTAVPHVVFAGNEDRLAGYTGLPIFLNPYFTAFGDPRPIAGVVLPTATEPNVYDIVFDTPEGSAAAPFRFRFWVNDTKPPRLRVLPSRPRAIRIAASDGGAGIDPASLGVTVDGKGAGARLHAGVLTIKASPGRHQVVVHVSDYQEAKNMEDVPKIKPNTATLTAAVSVRG
jgi:hypothetical protein